MGKINEILKSGVAPGAVCGERPFDPQSVFHKAPKGLRELENKPRFKGGPNHSASDMAKHMGMSLDFIKKTWSKPIPKAIACFLFAFLMAIMPARAGYITAGETLNDGQTVHASDLMNLVQNAIIGSGFIYSQPINNSPLQSDYIVEYSPTLGGLYKTTLLNAFLNNPQSITLLPTGAPIYTNQDLFAFYSAANTNLESINVSNLIAFFSTYANPALFSFAYTNVGTGTNTFLLPKWTGIFSGFNTNLPESIWWGTNGMPRQQSLLGLEKSVAADLGTNLDFPYNFNYIWFPWTIFGTNTVAPYTNSFGFTTNFPIFSAFQPNNVGSNLATLNAGDAIPVLSLNQGGVNTTMSLNALYQYFTNLNAFAAISRIQFNGYPTTIIISNDAQSAYGLLHVATNSFPVVQPYAVSIITNASQVQVSIFQTNTIFWVVPTATNNQWIKIYSTYANALAQVSPLTVVATGSGTPNQILYLTVTTSYNADVIADAAGNAVRNGVYDVYFRSPVANANYYVTGNVIQNLSNAPNGWANFFGGVNLSQDFFISTSFFRITTSAFNTGGIVDFPLVQILVNPQ